MNGNHDTLDELLRLYAETTKVDVPAHFGLGVWRNIRLRQAEEPTWLGFGQWLSNLWTQPQFGIPAITVALMVGLLTGWLHLDQWSSPLYSHQALGLDVFSTAPPSLPSTLIDSGDR